MNIKLNELIYKEYQTARVEGFIPSDQSFEEYLLAEVKRLRKTLACIAFSPDDPKWVGEKLDELAVDSDTWERWME